MRNIHKKTCEWCKKHFFSYEENKIFCTSTCLAKKKYSEMFYLKKPKENSHPCKECGEEILRESIDFCNDICRKQYNRKQYKPKIKDSSKKKRTRSVSYDELNRREEQKRLFDDAWALRQIRGYKW